MKFDVVARFCNTIPMVKFVSSSEIQRINFRFLTEITILPFLRNLDFLGSYSSFLYTQSWPYICLEKRKITKISKLPTIQEGYFRKIYKNLVERGSIRQKLENRLQFSHLAKISHLAQFS